MIVVAAILVVATLVVMTAGWVKPVVALGSAIVIAGLLGIAPARELFGGLSNGGVITVGAMLVIAKGIVQTGVVARVTRALLLTVTSARQALRRLAAPVGVASGLMNTTPIVAMMIPASKQLEQTRSIPAREVMLPIAHLTTLAGSITLIGTSSNLLIAGIASGRGIDMGMLSFAPVALPVALAGMVVIYFTAPRMLAGSQAAETTPLDWRVEIPIGEHAVARGRTADRLGLAVARDYRLSAVKRDGEYLAPDIAMEAGDILIFAATEVGIRALWISPLFGLSPQRLFAVSVNTGEVGTLNDLEENDDIAVIAARTTVSLRRTELVPGATCYVTAPDAATVEASEFVALWQDAASRAPQPGNTWKALLILAAVVLPASFGLAPIEFLAVAGALAMVLTKVLTPRSAARALDWNVLFILAGSVGLGRHRAEQRVGRRAGQRHPLPGVGQLRAGRPGLRGGHGDPDQRDLQRRRGVDPDAGGDHRRPRGRPEPGDPAGPDRHLHLVHLPQPVQPPDQPDGDRPDRLHQRRSSPCSAIPVLVVGLAVACGVGVLLA